MFSRLLTECIRAVDSFANDRAERLRCLAANVVRMLPSFAYSSSNVFPRFLTRVVGAIHSFTNSGANRLCSLMSDVVCMLLGLRCNWTDVFASFLAEAVESLPSVVKSTHCRCGRSVVLTLSQAGEEVERWRVQRRKLSGQK